MQLQSAHSLDYLGSIDRIRKTKDKMRKIKTPLLNGLLVDIMYHPRCYAPPYAFSLPNIIVLMSFDILSLCSSLHLVYPSCPFRMSFFRMCSVFQLLYLASISSYHICTCLYISTSSYRHALLLLPLIPPSPLLAAQPLYSHLDSCSEAGSLIGPTPLITCPCPCPYLAPSLWPGP